MSRLSKLYQAMDTLANEGLELSPEQEAQLRKAEEEIIQKEILPVLTGKIEPVLGQIERELVLVVDYTPGAPLKVSLSRKRNIFDVLGDAVEILPDPQAQHISIGPQKNKRQNVAAASRLRVTMHDGKVIALPKAKATLVAVIKRIGVERVRAIGLTYCKIPFISNTKDEKYGASQESVGGGWYVLTHSSTELKKKQLDTIASALGLDIKTEIIPAKRAGKDGGNEK